MLSKNVFKGCCQYLSMQNNVTLAEKDKDYLNEKIQGFFYGVCGLHYFPMGLF